MRDYSTQATRHRRPGKKGPTAAVGIALSIVLLGAVAAILIWLNQTSTTPDSAMLPKPSAQIIEEPKQAVATPETTTTIQQEVPEAPENFYTFYELLISGEVPIDIEPGQSRDEAIAEKLKSTVVQVASFRTADTAESTRVALLFLDLKARVIPPSQTNGGWYRIVLGPFKTVRDMRAAEDVLTKNGYDAQVRRE